MLDLHRNENCYGVSPAVRALLASTSQACWQYPRHEADTLLQLLASQYCLRAGQLLLGAGASTILQALLADFLRQRSSRLFYSAPVFPSLLRMTAEASCCALPWCADGRVDLAGLRERVARHDGPALVYLSHPDCHSGQLLDRAAVCEWIGQAAPAVRFVVDEAYIEFLPEYRQYSLLTVLNDLPPSLLVLRTFSKAYGLAGLRVGFAASRDLSWLAGLRQPLSLALSSPGLQAATEVLQDQGWLEHARWLLATARAALLDGLSELGLESRAGALNFVLHRLPGEPDFWLSGLRAAALRVHYPIVGLPGWCRVGVGSFDGVQRYLRALQRLLADRGH